MRTRALFTKFVSHSLRVTGSRSAWKSGRDPDSIKYTHKILIFWDGYMLEGSYFIRYLVYKNGKNTLKYSIVINNSLFYSNFWWKAKNNVILYISSICLDLRFLSIFPIFFCRKWTFLVLLLVVCPWYRGFIDLYSSYLPKINNERSLTNSKRVYCQYMSKIML